MWMVCGCACAAAVKRTPLWCRLSPRCFAGSLGSKRRSSGLHAMCFLPVSHLMNPPSCCGVGRILLIRLGWMARELQEPSCRPSSARGLQMHHHAQLSRGCCGSYSSPYDRAASTLHTEPSPASTPLF